MAGKKKKRPTAPPPPVRTSAPRTKVPAGTSPREQQREAARKAAAQDSLRRRLVAGGLVVAALAAVGAYVLVDRRGDTELTDALTSGSCQVDEQTDPTSSPPGNHVPSPTYDVDPPAGGNHLGAVATSSGTYAEPQVPDDGLLVHSLEHGYVVVWHQPGLEPAGLAQLTALQESSGNDVILVERDTLSVPVAATAWGHRLLCGEVEPETLERFVAERVGDGPEDVPRT